MRFFAAAALFLLAFLPATAQIFQISVTGTVARFSGGDSTIKIGTLVTETFTINSQTAPHYVVAGLAEYTDVQGTGTASVGDFTFTGVSTSASVYSNYENNGTDVDGFFLATPATFLNGNPVLGNLDLTLEGTDASDWPSTALSGIGQQHPLSDYSAPLLELDYNNNALQLTANVTSFNVTDVPEPSTWSLLLGVVGAPLFFVRRVVTA